MARQPLPEPRGIVRPRETTVTTPKAKTRASRRATHLDPLQTSIQTVTSLATKRGNQTEVETNESTNEMGWDDPILGKATGQRFPPEQTTRGGG
eukprot:11211623-Lingulodinium_polyedra.AAC.1